MKRCEMRQKALSNQLAAPDLGIGRYDYCRPLDDKNENSKYNTMSLKATVGQRYEVWCKKLMNSSQGDMKPMETKNSRDTYIKVWEGVDDACTSENDNAK